LGAITSTLAKKNLKQTLENFEHERDIYVWQKSLDDMVNAVIGGKIIRTAARRSARAIRRDI